MSSADCGKNGAEEGWFPGEILRICRKNGKYTGNTGEKSIRCSYCMRVTICIRLAKQVTVFSDTYKIHSPGINTDRSNGFATMSNQLKSVNNVTI